MPCMLFTIYQIILNTLTQGALQVLTSAVDCEEGKKDNGLYLK